MLAYIKCYKFHVSKMLCKTIQCILKSISDTEDKSQLMHLPASQFYSLVLFQHYLLHNLGYAGDRNNKNLSGSIHLRFISCSWHRALTGLLNRAAQGPRLANGPFGITIVLIGSKSQSRIKPRDHVVFSLCVMQNADFISAKSYILGPSLPRKPSKCLPAFTSPTTHFLIWKISIKFYNFHIKQFPWLPITFRNKSHFFVF